MSILWCGGEDVDFKYGINSPLVSTSSVFNSNYARCGLYLGNYCYSNPFPNGPVTEAWVHSRCYLNTSITSTSDTLLFGLDDPITSSGLWLRKTVGQAVLRKRIAGVWTTLATETGASLAYGSSKPLDLYIKYAEEGIFRAYLEGTLLVEYTGDLRLPDVTNFQHFSIYGSTLASAACLSEFIVADEDTRLMSLKTLAPNAAGDTNDWTGAYTAVDEVTNSDADLIYTDQFDQDFMCNLTGMPTGDFICKGVKIATRITDGIGGVRVQVGVKTNSEVDVSDTHELGGVFETVEQLYQENPITNNRFTPAEIEALQVVLRSKEIV